MTTRIYVVIDDSDPSEDSTVLVRAGNPAQALRAVTKGRFKVEVASQERLVALIAQGKRVEDFEPEPEDG